MDNNRHHTPPLSTENLPSSKENPLSLDNYMQSSASGVPKSGRKPWTPKQKRHYGTCLSFMAEALARGCKLLWVMLSTSREGDPLLLEKHFQELRRRIERKFGYLLDYYSVRTAEGNGVLHHIWAVRSTDGRRIFIDQRWLSQQWQEIHNSRIVWIKALKRQGADMKRVSRYLVSQYMANQSAVKRVSWSWWRAKFPLGKAYMAMKRTFLKTSGAMYCNWGFHSGKDTQTLTKGGVLLLWNDLLVKGYFYYNDVKWWWQKDWGCLVHAENS